MMSTGRTPAQQLVELSWQDANKQFGKGDFNEHTQHVLKKEWNACQAAPLFGLCIKNAVALNPVLNRSSTVRLAMMNWDY